MSCNGRGYHTRSVAEALPFEPSNSENLSQNRRDNLFFQNADSMLNSLRGSNTAQPSGTAESSTVQPAVSPSTPISSNLLQYFTTQGRLDSQVTDTLVALQGNISQMSHNLDCLVNRVETLESALKPFFESTVRDLQCFPSLVETVQGLLSRVQNLEEQLAEKDWYLVVLFLLSKILSKIPLSKMFSEFYLVEFN